MNLTNIIIKFNLSLPSTSQKECLFPINKMKQYYFPSCPIIYILRFPVASMVTVIIVPCPFHCSPIWSIAGNQWPVISQLRCGSMVLPVNLASLHWHSLPPSDLAASLTGYLTKSVYPVVLNYEIILFPCCDSLRKFTIKHYQSYSTYLLRTHGDLYMLSLQHGRPENS